jgi:limonene 1,2-monooxygenase
MRGERVTVRSDWFTLQDAALQLLPLQEDMPFASPRRSARRA